MSLHGFRSEWLQPGDLERLENMRRGFLQAAETKTALADYWGERRDLELYDAFFAERIGQKWDAVLDEVAWRAPEVLQVEVLVDWACGTGIAARRTLKHSKAGRVILFDRSERAMQFARERLLEEWPGVDVVVAQGKAPVSEPGALLLTSHLLNELPDAHLEDRFSVIADWEHLIWVESGTKVTGRKLSEFRDAIRATHNLLAPCPHQEPCSALAHSERDWCHFFAEPDPTMFTDGDVVKLARELGVDLRSLPYSFVCASRSIEPAARPASRMLGRPDLRPKFAKAWACDEAGLVQREFRKSSEPELYRAMKKSPERVRDLGER